MTGRPLPVAVVGGGNMGRHHARNYHELPEAELRAVVDLDAERARRLGARFGCRSYASLEALLAAEPEVAAVSVAVPTNLHFEVASRLLAAGKHVLVEKPIAAMVAEAGELVELAGELGLVLAVGHVERFNPAVRELKRRLASGELGRPLSMIARRVGIMPPQVRDANVILDLAVHDIDIFRYLLDAGEPDELYCNAGKAIVSDRYDFADIFLRFNEVGCFLQVNWLTPVKIRSLAATGTKGYAEVEYVTQRLSFYPAQTVRDGDSFADLAAYSLQEAVRIELEHEEPLARELREFVRAAAGEPGEIVTGEDARCSLEIVDAIVRLADEGVATGGRGRPAARRA